jgi:hypothetical protein
MSRLEGIVGAFVGLAQILVVYVAFVAHEFLRAGRSGKAVGIGAFFTVPGQPLFLVMAAAAFVFAFYLVVR